MMSNLYAAWSYIARVLLFIPFFLVLTLVFSDIYIFNVNWVPNSFPGSPVGTTLAAIVFNVMAVLLLISYVRCTFTSSAQSDSLPPPGWDLSNPDLRRCNKCLAPKANRAHHCSMCGKCVLKMDHHCPWVVNCVGYHNYKYFCLFVLYAFLACTFYALCIGKHMFSGFNSAEQIVASFGVLFSGILTIAFAVSLLFFVGFHSKLVFSNLTTIEFSEHSMQRGYAGNPYDLGTARKNFEAVFGQNPWFWFLPTAPTSYLGDGFFLSPHSHNGHAGFVSVDSQSSQSTAIRMDDSAADDGQSPPTDASLLV